MFAEDCWEGFCFPNYRSLPSFSASSVPPFSFLSAMAWVILWSGGKGQEISTNFSPDPLEQMSGMDLLVVLNAIQFWIRQPPLLPSVQWKSVINHNSLLGLYKEMKEDGRTLAQTVTGNKGRAGDTEGSVQLPREMRRLIRVHVRMCARMRIPGTCCFSSCAIGDQTICGVFKDSLKV